MLTFPARRYSMSTEAGKKGGHFARKSAANSLQSTQLAGTWPHE